MDTPSSSPTAAHGHGSGGNFWTRTPLYQRILAGLVLGVATGLIFGHRAENLAIPSQLVLRLLNALAPFLILVAVIRALMTANISGKTGAKLISLLLLNTTVAIVIGLAVANTVAPGRYSHIPTPTPTPVPTAVPAKSSANNAKNKATTSADKATGGEESLNIGDELLDNIPKSVLGPLGDQGKVIGVIIIAVAFGLALRPLKDKPLRTPIDILDVLMQAVITILSWVIEVVPLAVFGVVASIVGKEGFEPFKALGAFIFAVLLALFFQAAYYLARIRFASWVNPFALLRGARDAMFMAFSTSSSTVAMPLTYKCLRENVGLRRDSASLGALVGSNFNNDGTALYEAMAALFASQLSGHHLGIVQQLTVVLMSIIASVGAAGIPEAGLVTMTLVFGAVHLDTKYILMLLPVDWFLDRSRTVINMMGDMSVACVLDGKTPSLGEAERARQELEVIAVEEVAPKHLALENP